MMYYDLFCSFIYMYINLTVGCNYGHWSKCMVFNDIPQDIMVVITYQICIFQLTYIIKQELERLS